MPCTRTLVVVVYRILYCSLYMSTQYKRCVDSLGFFIFPTRYKDVKIDGRKYTNEIEEKNNTQSIREKNRWHMKLRLRQGIRQISLLNSFHSIVIWLRYAFHVPNFFFRCANAIPAVPLYLTLPTPRVSIVSHLSIHDLR